MPATRGTLTNKASIIARWRIPRRSSQPRAAMLNASPTTCCPAPRLPLCSRPGQSTPIGLVARTIRPLRSPSADMRQVNMRPTASGSRLTGAWPTILAACNPRASPLPTESVSLRQPSPGKTPARELSRRMRRRRWRRRGQRRAVRRGRCPAASTRAAAGPAWSSRRSSSSARSRSGGRSCCWMFQLDGCVDSPDTSDLDGHRRRSIPQ